MNKYTHTHTHTHTSSGTTISKSLRGAGSPPNPALSCALISYCCCRELLKMADSLSNPPPPPPPPPLPSVAESIRASSGLILSWSRTGVCPGVIPKPVEPEPARGVIRRPGVVPPSWLEGVRNGVDPSTTFGVWTAARFGVLPSKLDSISGTFSPPASSNRDTIQQYTCTSTFGSSTCTSTYGRRSTCMITDYV